ncbi:COMM domain-containing protein 3 [Agrilus planipennis]|uniref:COMM domain-containing protein 3 n=1 Tax=Agrilus planipennis TaxID=224129 RepID=A0A7F5RE28_AGRPL|nr:COMM domain-containing protein 3 [Agrilus planipennis]
MLEIDNNLKNSLKLANSNALSDENFKNLVQHCFNALTKKSEINNINSLYGSKPDTVKEIFASVMTLIAQFGRQNLDPLEVAQFLKNECHFNANRIKIISELYEENKNDLLVVLGTIGSHLPHITDVNWKIDYKIESKYLEEASGPIFRISLITEVFDEQLQKPVQKPINFTCTTQELQDLVYKLKDAVNHCERIAKKADISEPNAVLIIRILVGSNW